MIELFNTAALESLYYLHSVSHCSFVINNGAIDKIVKDH